jgi:uncharacterized membrane protein YqjE
MVRSGTPEPAGSDQSLGDLVSQATKDMSQLVRYEIELAKTELRADLKRVLRAVVLFGIAAFFGCLILFSLCFMWAYLLHTLGAWGGMWGAFGWTALTLLVLAVVAGFVAYLTMRHLTGMKKTRESVTEGVGMLRRGKDRDGKDDAKSLGSAASHDGQHQDGASTRSAVGGATTAAGELSADSRQAQADDLGSRRGSVTKR